MENNAIFKNIFERRSIRSYEAAPVDGEKLELIMKAGIWAPSASNTQPWHFTVITDAKTIDEINDMGKAFMAKSDSETHRKRGNDPDAHILHHAPCVILASYDTQRSWGRVDTGLATQNIMLAAHALGLGTCFIGFFTPWLQSEDGKTYTSKFPIPDGYTPSHFITLGTPAAPTPKRDRKIGTVTYYKA